MNEFRRWKNPIMFVLLCTAIGYFFGSALTGFFIAAIIVSTINLFF